MEWAIANPVVCEAPEPKASEVIEPSNDATNLKSSAKKRPAKALYVPKALRNNAGNAKSSNVIQTQKPVPVIKTWKDEIESQTGPIEVVEPLTDYLALETGCLTTKDKAFRRVIELGDFPKGKSMYIPNLNQCSLFMPITG